MTVEETKEWIYYHWVWTREQKEQFAAMSEEKLHEAVNYRHLTPFEIFQLMINGEME